MKAYWLLLLMLVLPGALAEVYDDRSAGIGIVLGVEQGSIVVKHILTNSPASASKEIHVGDRILAIAQDKEPAVGVENGRLAEAVHLCRGPKGTTVRLTIVPAGEDDFKSQVVSFVRAELKALSDWGDGALLPAGTKAPDIGMVALESGTNERLTAYAGKIIVLEFWATWCGPCQPKMAQLQSYSEKFPQWNGKVILIAASVDEKSEAPVKHLKEKGWERTHNVWVGVEAKRAYHIDAIPTAYVIDRQGKIAEVNPSDLPAVVNREMRRKE